MLIKRSFAILIVLITAMVCFSAWSEPEPKQTISDSKSGKLTTQESIKQKNPPPDYVTTQQLIDAISHAIEATADKAKTNYNSSPPKDFSGLFQLLLTIFTGFLVLVGAGQCYIIFKTLKETKKAADAAKDSADALPAIERAYVFSNIEINKDMSDPDTVRDFEAELWLKNHGKTPAIIKEIGFGGHCPANPFNKLHIHHPIESIVGSGDEVYETRYWFPITGSDWLALIDTKPTIKFFCIGYIKYITVFGEEDCHPFYWEFDGPSKRFVLVQSEKLNHDK